MGHPWLPCIINLSTPEAVAYAICRMGECMQPRCRGLGCEGMTLCPRVPHPWLPAVNRMQPPSGGCGMADADESMACPGVCGAVDLPVAPTAVVRGNPVV